MNAKKFMTSFSLILVLCVLLNVVLVQVNANENNKTKGGKVTPASVPSGNNADINLPKKDAAQNNTPPAVAESALLELKNVAQNLEKKTATNRKIIISAALINMVVLTLLSGIIGYKTKKALKESEVETAEEVTPEPANETL
ncbi:hypothetical protein AK88_01980 [Plasmodium fragile]|uniref:Sexual stage-specific protein n=1 Tax=Plasmodium fragile TaxID=5857 RepID=A0A0D9QMU1_PLAFR|nr:uncharacterized protein AK88_01980 [Plasmodium fragile]KJP88364.1 hypothetical protein AK88_01980 [Plasmodium fragile]